jgi:hypothetical protein
MVHSRGRVDVKGFFRRSVRAGMFRQKCFDDPDNGRGYRVLQRWWRAPSES